MYLFFLKYWFFFCFVFSDSSAYWWIFSLHEQFVFGSDAKGSCPQIQNPPIDSKPNNKHMGKLSIHCTGCSGYLAGWGGHQSSPARSFSGLCWYSSNFGLYWATLSNTKLSSPPKWGVFQLQISLYLQRTDRDGPPMGQLLSFHPSIKVLSVTKRFSNNLALLHYWILPWPSW